MGNSLHKTNRNYLLSESEFEEPTFSYDSFHQKFLSNPQLPYKTLEPHFTSETSRIIIFESSEKNLEDKKNSNENMRKLGFLQEIIVKKNENLRFSKLFHYLRILETLKETFTEKSPFYGFCGVEEIKERKNPKHWTFGVKFQGFGLMNLEKILEKRREKGEFYSENEVRWILEPLITMVSELKASNFTLSYLKISKKLLFLTQENTGEFRYKLLGFEFLEEIKENRNFYSDIQEIAKEMLGKNKEISLRNLSQTEKPDFQLKENGFFEYFPHMDKEKLHIYLDLFEGIENVVLGLGFLEEFLIKSSKRKDSLQEEAYWLNRYGLLLRKSGNFNKSLDILARVLDLVSKSYEENSKERAFLLNNIGVLSGDIGKIEKSLDFIKRSEELLQDEGKNLKTLMVLSNLGEALWKTGNFKASFSIQIEVLQMKRLFYPYEIDILFTSINNLALSFCDCGDHKLGMKLLQEIRVFMMKHPEISKEKQAIFYNSMGYVYFHMNDMEKAAEFFNKSLIIYEELLGKEDKRVFVVIKNLAGVEIKRKMKGLALDLLEKAWGIAKESEFGEEVREEIEEMREDGRNI